MSGAASSNIEVRIGFDKSALAGIPAARKEIETLERGTRRASAGLQMLDGGNRSQKLAKGMRSVAEESLRAFLNMGRIMGPLEVITGAASIAGLARLSSEWAGVTTQLGYSAQRAGVGIAQLNALQGAATLTGVSTQALTSGLTALNDNLTNAATGRAPQAVAAFNYLHVALRDANGQLRSSTAVLPELADALAHVKNPAIQAQLATTLLGGSAEELLPLLRQGAAGMANLTHEAQQYGVKTGRDLKISERFTRQQGELTLAIHGLSNSLGEHLAPTLGDVEERMAHFIRSNKDDFATAVTDWRTYLEGFSLYLSAKWLPAIAARFGVDLPGLLKETIKSLPGLTGKLLRALDAPAIAAGILLDPNTSIQNQKDEEAALRTAIERMNVARAKEGLPPLPMPMAQPVSLSQSVYQQDEPVRPISSKQTAANLAASRKFFLDQGWGPAATAGILSSEYSESRFNPGAVGDNGTSMGLFQWHNERAAQLQAWARDRKLDPKALATQLAFTQWDLTDGPHKAVGDALRKTRDAVEAGTLWTAQYERPAGGEAEARRRGEASVAFLPLPGAAAGGQGLPDKEHGHRNAGADVVPPGATGDNQPDGKYHSAITGDWLPLDPQPAAPAAHVGDGTGRGSTANSETTVKGSATVTVHLKDAPPGTRTSATSDGDLFANSGPVRVETSAVGKGMQP